MSEKIHLAIRVDPKSFQKVEVNGINFKNDVLSLKERAAEIAQLPVGQIELIFCGSILKDQLLLETSGVRPGVTIHVLKKKPSTHPRKFNPFSESDVLHLVSAFKNATKTPNYRTALQRLSRPSVLENIMVATPGLRDDPVALAMIQDPELLSQLCDAGTVRRVVEAHPTLAEAAHYIVAVVHEEAASSSSISSAAPSAGYFYSLEALSDEEDVESSQSSDSLPQAGDPSQNQIITPMSLAAAIAAAAQQARSPAALPAERSPAPTSRITSEMLGQALGQVLAATSNPAGGAPASGPPAATAPTDQALSDLETTSRRLAEHLQQMRELGLRDDTLNLQALQATDWNVHEAINLVFSGAMADLDSDME